MSSALAEQSTSEVSHTSPQTITESREARASANASAGINLNIFGAIAGAFSSKSKKETAVDGAPTEKREECATVRGAGEGNLNAVAAGNAEESAHHSKEVIQ